MRFVTRKATMLLMSLCGLVASSGANSYGDDIHRAASYPTSVQPAPGVGQFRLEHDADKPILGYYGGIGLYIDDADGKWTSVFVKDKSAVDYLIDRCRSSGMNRIYANIMFQDTESEIMGRLPERIGMPADSEKIFAYAVEQAHANNIQVYADIPVFGKRERDEPFVQANTDEIFARRADGSINPHFFSPANPRVRAYRIGILLEVLKHYPVDGIQLDFIRWEVDTHTISELKTICSQYGFSDDVLNAFRKRYALSADYVPSAEDERFVQERADYVTLFIEELHAALDRSGVDLPVGVYNSNIYGVQASLRSVGQDWAAWEEKGLVDEHHPMFYMDTVPNLLNPLKTLFDIKNDQSAVYGPIFLDGPGEFTEPRIVDLSRRMIKLGCDGIWFCMDRDLEQKGLWSAVKAVSELSISDIRTSDFDPFVEASSADAK